MVADVAKVEKVEFLNGKRLKLARVTPQTLASFCHVVFFFCVCVGALFPCIKKTEQQS